MLETIFIHMGGWCETEHLPLACTKNAQYVAQLGYIVRHAPIYHNNLPYFPQALVTDLQKSAMPGRDGTRPRTRAILSANDAMRYPFALEPFAAMLRQNFPQAAIKGLFTFSRQDKALEAYCGWTKLHGMATALSAVESYGKEQGFLDYHAALETAHAALGAENVITFLDVDSANHTCLAPEDILRQLRELEGDRPGQPADLPPFRPAVNLFPPGPLLDLAPASFFVRGAPPDTNSPWFATSLLFPSREGGKELFSPQDRLRLYNEFSESNRNAASLLGMRELFPKPEEKECDQYTGLSAEAAWEVIAALPDDLANELAGQFSRPIQGRIPYHLKNDVPLLAKVFRLFTISSPSTRRRKYRNLEVSVLTLSYNHVNFIEKNIQSVLEQEADFPVWHIIADDASTDGTQEVIKEYAARYPHIIPLLRPWNKPAENISALFSAASSKYVALCDGDDYFLDPLKLQLQVDYLENHPECGLCFHPVKVVFEDDSTRSRVYPTLDALPGGIKDMYHLTDLFTGNFIQTNSVMYRWRFRQGLPSWFVSDIMPGDWYWHLLHAETGNIGFIDRIMSVYRRHKNSVFYDAENSRLLQRSKVGIHELKAFKVIDIHFKRKYTKELEILRNGIFADLTQYYVETDDMAPLDQACRIFPKEAKLFFQRLDINQPG